MLEIVSSLEFRTAGTEQLGVMAACSENGTERLLTDVE
jgi:hypothetical protein